MLVVEESRPWESVGLSYVFSSETPTEASLRKRLKPSALAEKKCGASPSAPAPAPLSFPVATPASLRVAGQQTRKAYGRFWFRFMNGESGADVYDRATAFWESVFRSMDHNTHSRYKNYVIITHGLMMVGSG